MVSKKYKLNQEDFGKVGRGLLIAMAGAGLVYLTDVVPQINWGVYAPIVGALAAVLVNLARKLLAGK